MCYPVIMIHSITTHVTGHAECDPSSYRANIYVLITVHNYVNMTLNSIKCYYFTDYN